MPSQLTLQIETTAGNIRTFTMVVPESAAGYSVMVRPESYVSQKQVCLLADEELVSIPMEQLRSLRISLLDSQELPASSHHE